MAAFQKKLRLAALFVFAVFAWLSVAEAFHHHGALEDHNDCSFCAFQQADSKATISIAPLELIPIFTVLVLEIVSFPWFSFQIVQACGRSPPSFDSSSY